MAPLELRSRGGRSTPRAHASCSLQVLAQVFSRAALERYVPRLQGALRREVRTWCAARRPVNVYEATKALTFRMAARVLLGLQLDETQCAELSRTFEQFVENLFSLPLDVPFSGLRKVLIPQPRPSSCGSLGAPTHHLCWSGVVWRCVLGLPSALTCSVIPGGTHTLSGPDDHAPAAAAVGLLLDTLWQAPGQSSQPLPRMAPPGRASNTPLEARTAAERIEALGLQTRPRPSPAPAGVGEGWVPAPRPRAPGR